MEVIPGVHQVTARMSNMILLVEDGLTLIDTGFHGSSMQIAGYIRGLGRSIEELKLIIITHNHSDHVGSLAEFKRITTAEVAAGKEDLSGNEQGLPYRRYMLKLLHLPLVSFLWPLDYVRPGEVDIPLAGDEVLHPIGGLRVIATPGHTPGSISLYSAERKLLIMGDALKTRFGMMRLPPKSIAINPPQAIDSIKRLALLDFDTLCFGHGRPLVGDAATRLRAWIKKKGL
jgi:glyoxylase-like metal-dependent hydrolase (beta-lactamase superfamily II)